MKILMVCLGNICRSPMAEGILKAKIAEQGLRWELGSAGTENYHVGEGADRRAVRTAARNRIDISGHVARQLSDKDFEYYDIIYAMATDVRREILHRNFKRDYSDKIHLFMDEVYPGENRSVPDPWYGNEAGFQPVFELIDKVCSGIIKKVKAGTYYSL